MEIEMWAKTMRDTSQQLMIDSSDIFTTSSRLRTFLNDENFEDVIQFLREMHSQCVKAGDTQTIELIQAVIQICLACAEARDEARWRKKALAKAEQRRTELARSLSKILNSIQLQEPVKTSNKPPAPDDTVIEIDDDPRETSQHYRLWQRFQSLVSPQFATDKPETKVNTLPFSTLSTLATLTVLLENDSNQPSLAVYMLGSFKLYLNNQLVEDINRKGKLLLKYLLLHRDQRIPKEVLMDQFWPDAEPAAARNNLNVTLYGLRQALRQDDDSDFSHILFEDDCYYFNPNLLIWVDYEKFFEHIAAAEQLEKGNDLEAATGEYKLACTQYRGDLLMEDTYEEWLQPLRQKLQDTYVQILDQLGHFYFEHSNYTDCIVICDKILAVDSCREQAHRWLMQCYAARGQNHLALRQYNVCKKALNQELDVVPGDETRRLYDQIRGH